MKNIVKAPGTMDKPKNRPGSMVIEMPYKTKLDVACERVTKRKTDKSSKNIAEGKVCVGFITTEANVHYVDKNGTKYRVYRKDKKGGRTVVAHDKIKIDFAGFPTANVDGSNVTVKQCERINSLTKEKGALVNNPRDTCAGKAAGRRFDNATKVRIAKLPNKITRNGAFPETSTKFKDGRGITVDEYGRKVNKNYTGRTAKYTWNKDRKRHELVH